MRDIDEMDMLGYLKVRVWDAKHKNEIEERNAPKYIDEIWPSVKP